MNAIEPETTVDETAAGVMPRLCPMLGRRVEVIAHDVMPAATVRADLTLVDFLAQRLKIGFRDCGRERRAREPAPAVQTPA